MIYFHAQEEVEEEEPEELGDRRARSKKEIDYSDSLTEKEWLRAIGVSTVLACNNFLINVGMSIKLKNEFCYEIIPGNCRSVYKYSWISWKI